MTTAPAGAPKKKQRVGTTSRVSSTAAVITGTLPDKPSLRRSSSTSSASSSPSTTLHGGFNDSSSADTLLSLFPEESPHSESSNHSTNKNNESNIQIYLHSNIIRRSKYFSALLSNRWNPKNTEGNAIINNSNNILYRFNLGVSQAPDSINNHLTVLQLLYTLDFVNVICDVETALCLLPIALHLLFEECVKACVKFLEAVPWSEEEERRVVGLVPLLGKEEGEQLLVRVTDLGTLMGDDSSEEMLYGLILVAIHNNPNMAFAKAFVAKLLREFSSREGAGRVLDRAFEKSLEVVKDALEQYSSPDLRGDHNETEAIQRLNLHAALTNGKHLLWLVERMIELRVADKAVEVWSEQFSFASDLQRDFRDDVWRNIVPGLPVVLLKCTSRLSEAVATGKILAAIDVRHNLVSNWLPVLVACKDSTPHITCHKSLYLDLEKAFLAIISTLSMRHAQELLQQCLSFSTRNVEDCDHLVSAFTTWFRRAV